MRARRRLLSAAVVLATGSLVVGCTIGSDSGSGTPTTAAAEPAATITVPAADGGPINPTAPVVVNVAGGTLTKVTVTNPAEDNKAVAGDIAPDKTSWVLVAALTAAGSVLAERARKH